MNNDFNVRINAACRAVELAYSRCLAPLGINPIEAAVLVRLYQVDGQHPGNLARGVMRVATSFTPILNKLEGLELIERQHDDDDRRAVKIWLTQNARDIRAEVEAAIRDAEAAVAEALSDCGHPSVFLDMCVPLSRMDYIPGTATPPPPPPATHKRPGLSGIQLPTKPTSL